MTTYFSPASYEEVSAYMAGGRNPNDRPYPHGKHTRVHTCPKNGIAVRYHATDVVTYYPDRVVLNSGGWRTSTTRARISEALHGIPDTALVQRDWEWYLVVDGHEIPFTDGMAITWDGTLIP
ncbi:MAG TPA: hypothetical protein PKD55_00075 [Bellilinea sp.]|nr:hypothetical protein [Bellilinea sp.]